MEISRSEFRAQRSTRASVREMWSDDDDDDDDSMGELKEMRGGLSNASLHADAEITTSEGRHGRIFKPKP
ncbi:uncharacterized protein RAG0_04281 [Rhynchosporium agropyri]|uniref:Uncharacterized protein n=1 Tax=Rhynchosporium agropyri TaxID=914238 RepID=A0A1E1K893_9HELO|nr:uncharacterized protein RAG0_04281 [Rhynchosporium agropyri]